MIRLGRGVTSLCRLRVSAYTLSALFSLCAILSAALLHLSVIAFLFSILISVLLCYRVLIIRFGWRILTAACVFFSFVLAAFFLLINSTLSLSLLPFLADSGQSYAAGAIQLVESAGPAQYSFQFVRSFFFLALAMVLVRNAHATASKLLIWPTLAYACIRPSLVPFFSIARLLSPILLLQTLLLPIARKNLQSKTEVIFLGVIGLIVALLQSYQSFINLS
jgi:hypothetical protein